MKRKFNLLIYGVATILLATSVLAATLTGLSIFDSSRATNPENVLDTDSDFAELSAVGGPFHCPSGWVKDNGKCNILIQTGPNSFVGFSITGWLIADFTADNSALSNVSGFTLVSSDLCTAKNCVDYNSGLGTWVFTTDDLHAAAVVWKLRGGCLLPNDAQQLTCASQFEGSAVEGVLVGRTIPPKTWGDVGVHSLTVESN